MNNLLNAGFLFGLLASVINFIGLVNPDWNKIIIHETNEIYEKFPKEYKTEKYIIIIQGLFRGCVGKKCVNLSYYDVHESLTVTIVTSIVSLCLSFVGTILILFYSKYKYDIVITVSYYLFIISSFISTIGIITFAVYNYIGNTFLMGFWMVSISIIQSIIAFIFLYIFEKRKNKSKIIEKIKKT